MPQKERVDLHMLLSLSSFPPFLPARVLCVWDRVLSCAPPAQQMPREQDQRLIAVHDKDEHHRDPQSALIPSLVLQPSFVVCEKAVWHLVPEGPQAQPTSLCKAKRQPFFFLLFSVRAPLFFFALPHRPSTPLILSTLSVLPALQSLSLLFFDTLPEACLSLGPGQERHQKLSFLSSPSTHPLLSLSIRLNTTDCLDPTQPTRHLGLASEQTNPSLFSCILFSCIPFSCMMP